MNALDVVAPTRAPARTASTDPASADETVAEGSSTFLAMLSAAMQQKPPAAARPNGVALPLAGVAVAEEGTESGEAIEDDGAAPAPEIVVAPAPEAAPDVALGHLVRAAVAASLPPKPAADPESGAPRRPNVVVQVTKPATPAGKAAAASTRAHDEVTPESVALSGLLQHEEIGDALDAIAADNAVREADEDDDAPTPEGAPKPSLSALLRAAIEAQADAARKDAARPASAAIEGTVAPSNAPIDPAMTSASTSPAGDAPARSAATATPVALAKALPQLLDALGLAPERATPFAGPREGAPSDAAAPAIAEQAPPLPVATAAATGVDASTLAIDGVLAVRVEAVAESSAPADAAVAVEPSEPAAPAGPRVPSREAAAAVAGPHEEQAATSEHHDRDERGASDASPRHRGHAAASAPAPSSWSAHAAAARGEVPAPHDDARVQAPAAVRAPDAPMRGNGPTNHVTVQLDGDTMGATRVRVAVRGDSVRATVFADEGKASSLTQHLPELRRALEERGFVDARVTIQAEAAVDRSAPLATAAVSDDLRARPTGAARPDRGGNEQAPRGQRQHADPQRGQERRREAPQEENA